MHWWCLLFLLHLSPLVYSATCSNFVSGGSVTITTNCHYDGTITLNSLRIQNAVLTIQAPTTSITITQGLYVDTTSYIVTPNMQAPNITVGSASAPATLLSFNGTYEGAMNMNVWANTIYFGPSSYLTYEYGNALVLNSAGVVTLGIVDAGVYLTVASSSSCVMNGDIGTSGTAESLLALSITSSGDVVVNLGAYVGAEIVTIVAGGALVVTSGSTINAIWNDDGNTGDGSRSGYLSSGGSYGGSGGAALASTVGPAYGSFSVPTTHGSQGGYPTSGDPGLGGGEIYISADSYVQVDGTITVRGDDGTQGAAGGSGGGLTIMTNGAILGAGRISANGGSGSVSSPYTGGGGSGGRIALYYSSYNFTGVLTSHGGARTPYPGGPGTIFTNYFNGSTNYTTLLVDNRGVPSNSSQVGTLDTTLGGTAWIVGDGTVQLDQVILQNYGELAFADVSYFNFLNNLPFTIAQDVTLQISSFSGDNTGTLHVIGGQTLIAESVSSFNATLRVYPNATALLSLDFSVTTSPVYFYGNVCNVNTLSVQGALTLGVNGFTCGNAPGTFNFSSVVVGNSGELLSNSTNSNPVILYTTTCQYSGGYVDSTGLQLGNPAVPYTGSVPCTSTPSIPQTFVIENVTRSSLFVTWSAPVFVGNAALQGYEVAKFTSEWITVYSGPNNYTLVTGLAPNTTYFFRVRALNSFGDSEFVFINGSTGAGSVPQIAVPTGSATLTSIDITWAYPTDDGGYPIESYTLSYSANNATWIPIPLPNTTFSYNITSLAPNTLYYVRLSATNVLGTSQLEVTTINTNLGSPPGIISAPTFSSNSSEITITWQAPSNTGGYTIDNYTLSYSLDQSVWHNVSLPSTTFSYTISPVPRLTTYYVEVLATNKLGTSPFSPITPATTTGDRPSQLLAPSFSSYTRSSISLYWTLPSDNGGFPIDNFTLSFSLNSSVFEQVTVPNDTLAYPITCEERYTITNLTTGTLYYLAVSANNWLGSSPISPLINITTFPVICGDGSCDPNENCSTCFLDCGSCGYPKCPGTPVECAGHGACVKGVCACDLGWGNSDCSNTGVVPTNAAPNASNPSTSIHISGGSRKRTDAATPAVSFSVSFAFVREVDVNGNIVVTFPFDSLSQIGSSSVNGTTVYEYGTVLANKAGITVTSFYAAQMYTFAGQVINETSGTVKYNMKVSQWDFVHITNKLEIGINSVATAGDGTVCNNPVTSKDKSDILLSFQLIYKGAKLYGRFLDIAVLDGINKPVAFSYDDNNSVAIASVPHFWDYVEFDPDFQVLLETASSPCDPAHHKKTNKIVGGVIGGVAGIAMIAALVLFFFQRRREKEVNQILSNSQIFSEETLSDVPLTSVNQK